MMGVQLRHRGLVSAVVTVSGHMKGEYEPRHRLMLLAFLMRQETDWVQILDVNIGDSDIHGVRSIAVTVKSWAPMVEDARLLGEMVVLSGFESLRKATKNE